MKLMVKCAAVAAFALIGASSAAAATVTLEIDPTSQVKTAKMRNGVTAFLAPFDSILKFKATVANDAGAPLVPPVGQPSTIDLVARTVDGDKVVDTRQIFSADAGAPVAFVPQYLDQSTVYFARLTANPAASVAANTDSAPIATPAALKNNVTAFHSSFTHLVTISGFYSRPTGVVVRKAVRVMIQRRSGSSWKTVKILVPDAGRNWKAKVPYGNLPAVFRVRTVPVAPNRYVRNDDYAYCIAATSKLAKKICDAVPLRVG